MITQSYYKEVRLKSGKNIVLRTPNLQDAKSFSDYINELVDEDTFISSKKQSIEEEQSYIQSMLKKIEKGKEIHIIAVDKNKKIGAIDIFSQGVRKEHIGEMQINISKQYRGEGLGKIMIQEALRLSKEELKLNIIVLTCFSNNTLALALYKKFGFQEFGKLPKGIVYKNELIDEYFLFKEL